MAGLYEVVLSSTYFQQECLNRFNYLGEGSSGNVNGGFALLYALGMIPVMITPPDLNYPQGTLFRAIRDISSTAVEFTSVYVKNIYDPEDFYEAPFTIPAPGAVAGQPMPPFNAIGFRTTRTRTDIRRATKRFVGVSENVSDAGGVIVQGASPNIYDVLAERMAQNVSYTEGAANITFQPVVVGRDKVELPDTNPVRYSYRYYPTLEEQLERLSIGFSWELYPTVRSQNSRQYGRGR